MPLPASGSISMNQVNVELGAAGTTQRALNDTPVRTLFGKASGQISMSDGYGKSNFPGALGTYQSSQGGYYTGTQSGYYLWATTTNITGKAWKTTWTVSTNASSITDGYTNTMCNANATFPAFQATDALSAGGFSDWYIGACCELQQQYNNRNCGTIPTYGSTQYWSSVESGFSGTRTLFFGTGVWYDTNKSCPMCIRPIRRSLI